MQMQLGYCWDWFSNYFLNTKASIPHDRWHYRKLQETGIYSEPVGLVEAEPMTMPTLGLPSNAQGKPSPKAQRNSRFAGLRLH
jgi:hypothetical protein